jgi:hypothetical protein
VPVWLMLERVPVASVFTIHNLAYQGLFPASSGAGFGLPPWLFHPEALEYWGQWSFLKGGLVFADRLTTVSPSYAAEVRTPAFGEGLDGVLRARGPDLEGIVNGIEEDAWNPARDPALPAFRARARGRTQCVRHCGRTRSRVADDAARGVRRPRRRRASTNCRGAAAVPGAAARGRVLGPACAGRAGLRRGPLPGPLQVTLRTTTHSGRLWPARTCC